MGSLPARLCKSEMHLGCGLGLPAGSSAHSQLSPNNRQLLPSPSCPCTPTSLLPLHTVSLLPQGLCTCLSLCMEGSVLITSHNFPTQRGLPLPSTAALPSTPRYPHLPASLISFFHVTGTEPSLAYSVLSAHQHPLQSQALMCPGQCCPTRAPVMASSDPVTCYNLVRGGECSSRGREAHPRPHRCLMSKWA